MNISKSVKHFFEPLYNLIYRCTIDLFYLLPIKSNKIVFIQNNGGGYRCNLKYIAEEIIRQQLSYDMVWLVNSFDIVVPTSIHKVKYNRIRAVYELATAHVFINNSKSLYPVKKKKGQVFIYVPHGQPGCKCAEGDAKLPETWVKNSKKHSALTDIFVSMGSYHTQVLYDTFWVPKHSYIWEIGFPRNDIYYHDMRKRVKEIRRKLNIPDEMHIAFYAPTFRDNAKTEAYDLDLHRLLSVLEKKTGNRWVLFITMHGNFKWFKKPIYDFGEQIFDMTSYPDIHELLLLADIALSDYSSVALDFSNTRRPVFLYASDLDEYIKMRGLKDMYYKLPFSLSRNNDELERAIMSFNMNDYSKKLGEFYKLYGSFDDGHASERFVAKLRDIIK